MAGDNRSRGTRLPSDGRALLEWFTAISKPGQKLRIEDLSDGRLIWHVLQQIRPEFFDGELPEADTSGTGSWLSNWQNLKYIYKFLTSYITSEAGSLPKTLDRLDLQAVAKDEGNADSVKLLKMILFVALNADENAPYIEPMAHLPSDQQLLVQQAIMEFQDPAEASDENHGTKGTASGDKDLYWEEQLATMTREKEKLLLERKDLLASLREQAERNTRLTSNNSSLQEKLSTLQEKLENSPGSALGGSVLKDLESKLKDQEDHIAYQETQLADLQQSNEDLQRGAAKYRDLQDKFQPLQDEFDELKVERDQLFRKANAMDKYKAKLQTLADLEKENESLRSAMDELREANRDGNSAQEQVKALERQIDEMSRMIPAIEQELFESKMMKQQADENTRQLRKQLEDSNSKYEQDQSTIRDLMDQVQSGSGQPRGKDSLDNELGDDETDRTPKKTDRFPSIDHTAEIKRLEEALASRGAQHTASQSMLDAAKRRNKQLEAIIEDMYTARNGSGQSKRGELETDLQALELQQERGVFSPEEGDSVVVVDKDELRRMRNYEEEAKQAALLRDRNKDLESEVAQRQAIIDQHDTSNGAKEDLSKQQAEQITTYTNEIKDLKKQLEASKPALLKASEQLQLKQQIETLKRENKLVASAFYDLSSRLQLNNVSLQRRSDAPRSFLNKQRLLVSQATAVRMPR